MKPALTTSLLLTLAATVLAATVAAQDDTIHWQDGTKTKVTFVDFTAKEITYKVGGRKKTAPAHKVRDVTVKMWVEDIANKCTQPDEFLTHADEQMKAKKWAAAAFCYREAFKLFMAAGDVVSATSALSELNKKLPNSPWTPLHFSVRIEYYLGERKWKDALKVSEQYESESVKRSWARGYEHEAKFFTVVTNILSGKLNKTVAVPAIEAVLGETGGGVTEFVFNRAQVFLADFHRQTKDFKKAGKIYDQLTERTGVAPNVLGRAYLGLGYIDYEKGVVNKDKAAFYQAYMFFLRVYILARDANNETVAEGMFRAAEAVEQWGGMPTSRWEAARLRSRLRNRERWKHTSWAKKKR